MNASTNKIDDDERRVAQIETLTQCYERLVRVNPAAASWEVEPLKKAIARVCEETCAEKAGAE